MTQEQFSSRPTEQQEVQEEVQAPAAQAQSAGVDDLLDEIDGVLERNAEEFVRGFVQKGGQ